MLLLPLSLRKRGSGREKQSPFYSYFNLLSHKNKKKEGALAQGVKIIKGADTLLQSRGGGEWILILKLSYKYIFIINLNLLKIRKAQEIRKTICFLKMLTLLLLIPLLGSLIILPMSNTLESKNQMKKIALTTSLINFFISLFLWYEFDSNCATQFQFVSEFNQLSFCHLNFGVDGISLYFVILTTFVTPIALLSNYRDTNIQGKNLKLFLISLLVLETLQICAFVSLDLLLFYIFFESVLPILFIVIVIFGHGKDRFRSAFLFFLYTLAGSLPMLLSILVISTYIGNTDFQLISLSDISLESQKLLWLGFFVAFAVKTPLYPFIIWLPKAHSDSPLAGSILLAATILKLATYGALCLGMSQICAYKLSNSGDTLKLMIPNYY
jgi:NADH:ubiquinone oxidoreductase subunit 4 (subunit M)